MLLPFLASLVGLQPAPVLADVGPRFQEPGPTANYVFRIEDPAEERVHAELELRGLKGPLDLRMPERFAYAQLPEPRLEGEVAVLFPEAATLERRSPYAWRLDPAGSERVRLAWTVPLDHRTLPEVRGRDDYEFPYLRADHGMLVMGSMVLSPGDALRTPIDLRFELPEGWEVHAPWPAAAPGAYRVPDHQSLYDDLVAIGRWEIESREVRGMNLTIAFSPGQERLREAVLETAPEIVAAELELFGVVPQDGYLFLFGEPQHGGYGGSPKTRSMTLFVDPDFPVEIAIPGLEHLIAHEFHHTWMRARCELPAEMRFVAEGFTDYYAYVVLRRLGRTSQGEFLRTLGDKMAEFEVALTATEGSLVEAGGPEFFSGGAAYRATYAGGLVLALWLDLALRRSESPTNLDALLRDLYEDPRWRDGTNPQPADLWRLVEAAAGAEVAARAQRIASSEGAPDLRRAFRAVGVELVREVVPSALDLQANLDGTTLLAIDPADASHRIGLRAGDRLLLVNGVIVEDEHAVRDAWSAPREQQIHVRFERPGEEDPRTILAAVPEDVVYRLPVEVAYRLR